MTINEIIYDVLDGLNISTDDFPVRKRFVYQQLKDARAELIKQELNKNVLFDVAALQTINSFKMERTDISRNANFTTGEYMLQSIKELPKTIEFKSGVSIYPFFMNGVRIDAINMDVWPTRARKRYKLSNSIGFDIKNNKLIIIGYDDIEELDIYVSGHFRDPEKIEEMNLEGSDNCDENACKPIFENDFICPALIERRVVEIAKAACRQKLSIPSDNSNNAEFDPNVKSQTQPGR